MRFKLDENIPASLAVDLAALGHDVDTAVDEGLGGNEDDDVWAATQAAARVLIEFGKLDGRLGRSGTSRAARGDNVLVSQSVREEAEAMFEHGERCKRVGARLEHVRDLPTNRIGSRFHRRAPCSVAPLML